jgi:hypothetical protein
MMALRFRFDPYLSRLTVSALQDVAQGWGGVGKGKVLRDQYIRRIEQGLSDPKQVKLRIRQLEPYQLLALQIAKARKGIIATDALIMVMKLIGMDLPEFDTTPFGATERFAKALMRSGVFIPLSEPDRYGYGYGIDYNTLITDERLLSQIDLPDYPPLSLPSTAAPAAASYRRPANVILSVLGVMQSISDLGGIKITKSGAPQVNSLKKLNKAQQWGEDGTLIDGFWFPQPAIALLAILLHSSFLAPSPDGTALQLAIDPQTFAELPQAVQIGQLMVGVSLTSEWVEWSTQGWFDIGHYLEARQTLLLVLQLLPLEPEAWYNFDQVADFLHERIGAYLSLTGFRGMPIIGGPSAQQEETLKRIRQQHREQWDAREKQWIRYALSTWLYFLGIVELGVTQTDTGSEKNRSKSPDRNTPFLNPPSQADAIASFRLTELGRSILHPTLAQTQTEIAPQPAWIVQPNFEILVYLDDVAPTQMVFLEQYCDRIDAQSHTVQYRITRETVYQGLERGGTLETFLDGLKTGAKVPLPQNVEIDIQQWGQLREQMTLRRKTQILEFTNSESRQAAIAKGTTGELIGDRFLLITQEPTAIKSWIKQKIHYNKPLRSCLSVNETGEIKQVEAVADLIFQTQLERWVEQQDKKGLALTQASVSKAVKAGHKASDILDFLEIRLTHSMPPLLRVALMAWAGRPAKLEMEDIIVLRCLDSALFDAIVSSEKLRSHFIGQLSPSLLLVDRSQLKKLKQDLEWLGITPATQLLNVPTLDD